MMLGAPKATRLWDRIRNLLGWPFLGRQRKLAEQRTSYSKDQFLQYFDDLDVDRNVVSDIWDELSPWICHDSFKPMPDDNLAEVFGIVDDDVDDFVLDILKKHLYEIPPPSVTLKMPVIATVADIVRTVAAIGQNRRGET